MSGNFTYMWQKPTLPQGNKTWKGRSIKSVIPIWSKPYANSTYFQKREIIPSIGPDFKARPIKQWRKQLEPRDFTNKGKTGVGIPMDRPGGQSTLVYSVDQFLEKDKHCKKENSLHISEYILDNNYSKPIIDNIPPAAPLKILNRDKYNPQMVDLSNPKVVCTACNAESNRLKTGSVNFNNNYSETTAAYLDSRCKNYEKNRFGMVDPTTITFNNNGKITWPDNTNTGPQNRIASNCHIKTKNNISQYSDPFEKKCNYKIVYKPNNIKFAKQGGVSSSSRVQRLKYDRLTENGAQFITSRGARATNDGFFLFNAMSQYFIKTKYQDFITRRKPGNHSNCFFTPTGSVGGKSVPPSQKLPKPTPPPPVQYFRCGYGSQEGQCIPDPKGLFLAGDCDRCIKTSTGCSNCTDPAKPCYNTVTGSCAKTNSYGACDGQLAGVINCRDVGKGPCEICPADSDAPCYREDNGSCEKLNPTTGACDGQLAGVINCKTQGLGPCDICPAGTAQPCYDQANGLCLPKNAEGDCDGQNAGVINCDIAGKKPCEICEDPSLPCYNPETEKCIGYSGGICTGGLVDCGDRPSPDEISCTKLPTGTPPIQFTGSNANALGITIFFKIDADEQHAVYSSQTPWINYAPTFINGSQGTPLIARLGQCSNDDGGSGCDKLALTCVASTADEQLKTVYDGKIWRYKGGANNSFDWIYCNKPTECLS